MQNQEHLAVIKILKDQRKPELFFQFGPELMQGVPEVYIDAVIEQVCINKLIDIKKCTNNNFYLGSKFNASNKAITIASHLLTERSGKSKIS